VIARERPVWGSALTDHPHVHCIVPGGGIALDGQRWIAWAAKPDRFRRSIKVTKS
jgi:Putative transposase